MHDVFKFTVHSSCPDQSEIELFLGKSVHERAFAHISIAQEQQLDLVLFLLLLLLDAFFTQNWRPSWWVFSLNVQMNILYHYFY